MGHITRFASLVAGIAFGASMPAFAEPSRLPHPATDLMIVAQATTVTRDAAINTATKVKRGKVLKATLEKHDNQVVWDVRIQDQNQSTASVQIDPKSGDVVKSIDNVRDNSSERYELSTFKGGRQFVGQ